jgi:hypothetical protein
LYRQLDGVDYNWEYPGYRMGLGYLEEKEILKVPSDRFPSHGAQDYEGLAALVEETALVFRASGRLVTLAYYPDKRQERCCCALAAPPSPACCSWSASRGTSTCCTP